MMVWQRWAAHVIPVVKNPPANAGYVKRPGFNPWVPEIPEGMAINSSNLAQRIPWTEEPEESDMTYHAHRHGKDIDKGAKITAYL